MSTPGSHASGDIEQPQQQPTAPTNITDNPGPIEHHEAHHIAEFGQVEDLVHIDSPVRPSDDLPAPPVSHRGKLAVNERLRRLKRKTFRDRNVHQYWQGETLFRTASLRTIGPDELFLDLVIVGGIAALGHELRESFDGWLEVEKFILLFGALILSWRNVVFVWNVWGVASDLIDKMGIYFIFTCLAFIALGAHGAFLDNVRTYVGIAAFLASAVPAISSMVWGFQEPLVKSNGFSSQLTFFAFLNTLTVLPYFAAAFVTSERVTRILYWIPLSLNLILFSFLGRLFRLITKDNDKVSRIAVNIELYVEKHDVLTMIVLGESVLGIFFEGAEVVTVEGARLGPLFGACAMSTAMLYALQTLYNNVDAPIAKGGKHAIRYKRFNGSMWSILHVPYHASLILFATGLGISMRDIAIPPKASSDSSYPEKLIETVMRAGGSEKSGFNPKARWLFSAGWGLSIMLSGLISNLHLAGPRAATKKWRFLIRCIIVTPIMVGIPFTDLSADSFVYVHGSVLVFLALFEYMLVQMDKMGFFKSEATMFSSSTDAFGEQDGITFDDDDTDTSEDELEEEINLTHQLSRIPTKSLNVLDDLDGEHLQPVTTHTRDVAKSDDNIVRRKTRRERVAMEINQVEVPEDIISELARQRLRERMCKSHKSRLVATPKKKCSELKDTGVDLG